MPFDYRAVRRVYLDDAGPFDDEQPVTPNHHAGRIAYSFGPSGRGDLALRGKDGYILPPSGETEIEGIVVRDVEEITLGIEGDRLGNNEFLLRPPSLTEGFVFEDRLLVPPHEGPSPKGLDDHEEEFVLPLLEGK